MFFVPLLGIFNCFHGLCFFNSIASRNISLTQNKDWNPCWQFAFCLIWPICPHNRSLPHSLRNCKVIELVWWCLVNIFGTAKKLMRRFITSLTKLIELAVLIIHLVTNKPDFGWPSSLYIAVLFFPWFFTLMFYFLVCIGYLEKCYKSSSFQVQNYEITSNLEHYKSYWPSRNQFVGGIGDSRLCLYFRWRICYQWCLGFSYTSQSNNLLYRPNKP